MSETPAEPGPHCPAPKRAEQVTMAHGGGGRLTHSLVRDIFAKAFLSETVHDGHVEVVSARRITTTVDGYVVRPMFFPGGDIGSLAVNGTVNDLAMCGARPECLTAGFIIEEGTEFEVLRKIAESMADAAYKAGTRIVAGDTKVVERGKGDGVYITTSGFGVCEHELDIHPRSIRAGDAVILSGDVGRHGMAVMSAREGLSFESSIRSDCRSLWTAVQALLGAGLNVHCLRDLTRGGLATGIIELAAAAQLEITLEEGLIPITLTVQSACELMGFDPLYVANEGCFVAVVPEDQAKRTVDTLRSLEGFEQAARIGTVTDTRPGQVSLRTKLGTLRNMMMLSGEQLPRIC